MDNNDYEVFSAPPDCLPKMVLSRDTLSRLDLPALPVEILELIIDFCAQPLHYGSGVGGAVKRSETLARLRSWSLTCKALVQRSRFHLWRQIPLRNKRSVDSLVQTLRTYSHITTFIHTLEVLIGVPTSVFTSLMQAHLDRLPHIRIRFRHGGPINHKVFHQTISRFRTVTILSMSFPIQPQHLMRLLCSFPTLRFLEIEAVVAHPKSVLPTKHYAPKFRLECCSLNLSYGGNSKPASHDKAWAYILKCLVNTSHCLASLAILEVNFGVENEIENALQQIQRIFSTAHLTLKEVVFNYRDIVPRITRPIPENATSSEILSLSDNVSLQTIIVRLHGLEQKAFPSLVQILKTLPVNGISYFGLLVIETAPEDLDGDWWKDLDDLLSSDRFIDLNTVSVGVILHEGMRFAEKLVKTKRKGLLHPTEEPDAFDLPTRRWMQKYGNF